MATIAATAAPGDPATPKSRRDRRKIQPMWVVGSILIVLYAIIPILWILSLSLKPQSDITDGSIIPKHFSWVNYSTIFGTGVFVRPLINSIGITLISTVIAVVLATLAAYAIARLELPGQELVLSVALGIAMFPPISIVGPLFNMWRSLGLYDTWPGLIIPLHDVRAADGDLDALGVLPADPVGARAGSGGRRRHPVPGVPQGDRSACCARGFHVGDPGVLLRLERLRLRHHADVDGSQPYRSPRR